MHSARPARSLEGKIREFQGNSQYSCPSSQFYTPTMMSSIPHTLFLLCPNDDVIDVWITHIPHVNKNPFKNLLPYNRAVFQALWHVSETQDSYRRNVVVRWSTLGENNLIERILQVQNTPSLVLAYSREKVCISFSLLIGCSIIITRYPSSMACSTTHTNVPPPPLSPPPQDCTTKT